MTRQLIIAAAIASLFISCKRTEPVTKDIDFQVEYSSDELPVSWETGSKAKLFTEGDSGGFVVSPSGKTGATVSGHFSGGSKYEEGQTVAALFPFREDAVQSGSVISTVLPSEQIAEAGAIADGMNVAAGVSSVTAIRMHNVCGSVAFSVSGSDIGEVVLQGLGGEKLSGSIEISLSDSIPSAKASANASSDGISLKPKAGGSFEAGKLYYFCVIPCTLDCGYSLTFKTATKYSTVRFRSPSYFQSGKTIKVENADKDAVYTPIGTDPWDNKDLTIAERLLSLPDVISVSKLDKNNDFPLGVYDVRFNLPIDHKNPSKGHFSNKVYVAVKNTDNPNVFLIGGYSAMLPSEAPEDVTDIFECNQFSISHREFVDATTGTDYAYLGTDQAAADQKQVYDNLKLMFKKRMVITGASKGGICTALFAGYYPQVDAVYFPKVAPFCRKVGATEGHSFLLTEVGKADVRKRLLNTQRKLLVLMDNKTVMDEFRERVSSDITDLSTSITDIFYYVVQDYGANFWQSGGVEEIPADELTGEDLWLQIQVSSAFLNSCNYIRNNPYYIQGLQELGSFGYLENMSDIYVPTQKNYLKALLPDRFHNLQHNAGATFDRYVDQAVSVTDKPMFFLYGGQDAWTVFAIEDKYINDKNVKKYTVPGRFHNVDLNSIPGDDRQKAVEWFRYYINRQ